MSETKLKLISFLQTFLSSFVTILGGLILTVNPAILTSPQAWTITAVWAVVLGALRTALKMAWEKSMPLSFGGKQN